MLEPNHVIISCPQDRRATKQVKMSLQENLAILYASTRDESKGNTITYFISIQLVYFSILIIMEAVIAQDCD
jgi:hypothetical protein